MEYLRKITLNNGNVCVFCARDFKVYDNYILALKTIFGYTFVDVKKAAIYNKNRQLN